MDGRAREGERDHVAALTGVRAFAALWVFVFHGWLNAGSPALRLPVLDFDLSPLARFGWLGVDVFFVLSGFLLTRQHLARLERPGAAARGAFARAFGDRYATYLKRRILRVYPAYYASLAALLALAAAGVYGRLPERLDLALHLAMAHNVVDRYVATMNGVFWTLPFEWSFYLVFPFLFVLLRRHGALALYAGALAVVLLVKGIIVVMQNGYLQLYLPIRLDAFVAGMCGGAYAATHALSRRGASSLFVAGALLLFATPWVFANHASVHHHYDPAGYLRPLWIQAAIVALLLGVSGARHAGVALLDNRVAVGLGLVSYSIYLVHVPILELVPRLVAPGAPVAPLARNFAIALPLVLAVATLWYLAFERPFQRSVGSHPIGFAATLARAGPMRVLALCAGALFAFRVAAA
jgi:peptidoglycan/LPS O-acetylase OafA/YrhL